MGSKCDFDVAVVGYGPTGSMLAIRLGQLGYRVGVFERWFEIYDLPRAVHFDDEVGRIFQAAGMREEVLAITDPVPDFYEWRNRRGETLLKLDWATERGQGWPTANFFTQPELQSVLDRKARTLPGVEVFQGWEVCSVTDGSDHVVFDVSRGRREAIGTWAADGETRQFTARYLIGADGANSAIRQSIASEFHDLGFVPFDWLIVDVIPHDQNRMWAPMNWQLCDPSRPTTIVSGGPGRRRWEFMRLPGESIEELNTEATAWCLLEPWGMTPQNAELERHAVYRFMARYAERWRQGPILLAGDAAHLMPPFAGQGMCNGLRDASNLVWKLDLILRGVAPESLLDSYQSERLDHVRQWIDFSAALGEVICVLDEAEARERDERMLAGDADPTRVLPAAPPAGLSAGLLRHDQPVAGTLFIQGRVAVDGVAGLFDDVVGTGFCLIGRNEDPLAALSDEQRAFLTGIRARAVWLAEPPSAHRAPDAASGDGRAIVDVDGAYEAWFAACGCHYVFVRPDFCVFGVAGAAAAELSELVEALVDGLLGTVPVEAERDRC
jgi:2-polyprenyl-6-methoxyphenol hydroxylase-like FAD-dependent oxidoreductase